MAEQTLSSAPSMAILYPKAAAGVGISVLRRLPGIGDGAGELPDDELVLPDIEVDREHLAAYDRVCTFEIGDTLPVTYPHILAFPLSMKLMTDTSFPFAVVGLVHIENRIEQRRPIGIDERLTLRVRTDNLGPHDKGTQFEVIADAEVGGERVWHSVSTYLHRESSGSNGGSSSKERKKEGSEPPEPSASFTVPGDIGRRYAAVSGDRNPIHLHPLSARLFGMPGMIAHGMWLKARSLALLDGQLPDAYTAEARFKLPVRLGGRVALATWAEGGLRRFAMSDAKSGKPHLDGRIEPGR